MRRVFRSARIDMDKVNHASRFDGKWVLTTNMDMMGKPSLSNTKSYGRLNASFWM